MKHQPQSIGYEALGKLLGDDIGRQLQNFYMDADIAMMNNESRVFRRVLDIGEPLRINDTRMGLIMKGSIDVIINLQEKCLSEGHVAYLGPGSIVQPLSVSDDFEIYGTALFSQRLPLEAIGQWPQVADALTRDFQARVDKATVDYLRLLFETLWTTLHLTIRNDKTLGSIVAAIMYQFADIYRREEQRTQGKTTLFDRFIALVNQQAGSHRQLDFYASELCLTPRYLGTLIKQASGLSAKEWIDRAVIAEAKILLRHSTMTVAQIADRLSFPNPSFFCKYFLRLVGQTPMGYRSQ